MNNKLIVEVSHVLFSSNGIKAEKEFIISFLNKNPALKDKLNEVKEISEELQKEINKEFYISLVGENWNDATCKHSQFDSYGEYEEAYIKAVNETKGISFS